jgi:diacylglycerol kinase family enzyme
MRRIVAIVNAGARSTGGAEGAGKIEEAFRRHGLRAEVRAVRGALVAPVAREAVEDGAEVVVAAGGDGTVSGVASALVGTEAALGVLPLGTLNHFAHDVRVPLELDVAIEAIGNGGETRCDAGAVNGLAFVNNATLGLYPDQVRVRERLRRFIGKWPAAGVASLVVMRRFPSMRLSIEADGEAREVRTPLVVVSNNPYGLEAGRPHGRPRVDGGALGLYVVRDGGRWRFLKTAIRSLVVSLEGDAAFDATTARSVVVGSRRRRVKVALDGEVVKMRTPLRCESLPGALRVVGMLPAKDAA